MPPRGRFPLLFLGFVGLAFGVAGGLARLTPLEVPVAAVALHGPLMVSAFLGTLIALERAVALGRLWAYAAPLAAGLGGVALLSGLTKPGFALLVAAAVVLVAGNLALLARQASLETAALAGGAASWLAGNLGLLTGHAAVPWWIAFFALTIGAERLELTRYLKRGAAVRASFALLAAAMLVTPLFPRLLGAALVLLAAWLLFFDLARFTVRSRGLPRYVAVCLLAGYFWLALAGVLIGAALRYDAALHAFFVGFVLSMVFGHAPVILPAVLRVALPYRPVLYVPLALLHASLALRALGLTVPGAWGNAAALALFIVTAATLALDRRQSARASRR